MKIRIYQADAFTSRLFAGNPAAVCPLDYWPDNELLQNIALENNLSETAFYVKQDDYYEIRWFTPSVEVDLCGHATLATAFVLFNHENHSSDKITFHTRKSGFLNVSRNGDLLTLDFPADKLSPVELSEQIKDCFNFLPRESLKGRSDLFLVFEKEEEIRDLVPDLGKISKLDYRGVIVTATGNGADFVSRFFAPQSGVNEDPVTGSAHTSLTPYWAVRLGKKDLTAIQLSSRRGWLGCRLENDRVEITGQCRLFMKGELEL